jgi:membrane protein
LQGEDALGVNAGQRRRSGGWANPFALGLALGVGLVSIDLLSAIHRATLLPPVALSARRPRMSDWPSVVWRTLKAFSNDRIPTAAAAITFYMLLAIFPALSAFVSLYSLVANVQDAQKRVSALTGLLPGGAINVLSDELTRLSTADQNALGLAFIVSLGTSIWSANAGAKALIEGLNVAYERRESRNFVHLTLISLAFTLGVIALAVGGVVLIVSAPAILDSIGLVDSFSLALIRWPLLLALGALLLSIVYRFGPSGRRTRWRWITPGGVLAACGWLLMSNLFSWYVANFGHYNKTYGSLGAIVGFLTWMWMSLMVVLLGAEFNSEIETVESVQPEAGPGSPSGNHESAGVQRR